MSTKPQGGPGSLFLVDGNNFLFRAYHGLPMLNAPDGTPVNAVHGYVRMIQALRKEFAPQYLLSVFDAKGGSWRRDLYSEYKANRPPPPDDLIPQIRLVREATDALSIPWVEKEGFEADDLIASYAQSGKDQKLEVVIVSSDKDLMQLIGDEDSNGTTIRMWDTMKNRLVGPETVVKKFGVPPEKLGDLLALAGDSVDNIPGVPGIGPKTACTLLEEYGDLEGVLTRAEEVKQKKRRERLIEHAEDARLSRRLVELKRDCELPLAFEELQDRGTDADKMQAFFGPLGFKSTLAGAVTTSVSKAPATADGGAIGLGQRDAPDFDPKSTRILDSQNPEEWTKVQEQLRKAGRFAFALALSDSADPMRAEILGLAFAAEGMAPAYLPLRHRSLSESPERQLTWDAIVGELKSLLEDGELKKCCYELKNCRLVLHRLGITMAGDVMDPMLASYTIDPARTKHEIEALAEDVLQIPMIPLEKVIGKGRKQISFDQSSIEDAAPYFGQRVEFSRLLSEYLAGLLERVPQNLRELFYQVELPLARVLEGMEERGILVDAKVLAEQSAELTSELEGVRGRIESEAGYAINPESPQQLQKFLFEERGLPAKKKTKTGYSTDAQVLEELTLYDPVVKDILAHRSLVKLKNTYLDALPEAIHPDTGRLHTHFRQAVAQTGRLSSREPNLQNIPIRTERGRRIRQAFVAPPGRVLVTLDYSQIELRILAHLSEDPSLIAAFRDGSDVHRKTASEVFEVSEDQVTSEQRHIAKAVNFGVVYGQSAFGLSRQLGIPQGRAGKYIKSYFQKIPGVDAYMKRLIEDAKRDGYAETIFGRRRRIPELKARGAAKAYGERIARNTPIQGSAADILKRAMVAVEEKLSTIDWAQSLLTVHDELIFECEESRVDELISMVKPAMEGAATLRVPLVVEGGAGKNWEAAKGD